MASKGRHSRAPSRRSNSLIILFGIIILCFFLIIALLAFGILSIPTNSGNSPNANDLSSIVHNTVDRNDVNERRDQWVEVISWEPRAVIYHNFLSKDECEYLINLGKPHMKKSTVVDGKTGKSTDSRVRTSSGMFLKRGRDKVVQTIEKRIADFTFIPVGTLIRLLCEIDSPVKIDMKPSIDLFQVPGRPSDRRKWVCYEPMLATEMHLLSHEHGEGLQILHYEVGQKYEPHNDYFLDTFNTNNGGQRVATLLMYLSDVKEGGETVFPKAKGNFSSLPWWNELSECGKGGLSVIPKMGNALLFWNMKPDATVDTLSLHGGCPVIRGNKWSSTKWMRVSEYFV